MQILDNCAKNLLSMMYSVQISKQISFGGFRIDEIMAETFAAYGLCSHCLQVCFPAVVVIMRNDLQSRAKQWRTNEQAD